jgi:hypothetical protein
VPLRSPRPHCRRSRKHSYGLGLPIGPAKGSGQGETAAGSISGASTPLPRMPLEVWDVFDASTEELLEELGRLQALYKQGLVQ